MKLRLLLLPAALLLLLGACRHKQSQPKMIYVDSATRQHFAFRPGSYWIYKDSVSGRVDSCYVTRHDSFMVNSSDYSSVGQVIYSDMNQFAIAGSTIKEPIAIGITLRKGGIKIDYNNPIISQPGLSGIELAYPFTVGPVYAGVVTDILPDFLLSGHNYNNVVSYCQEIRYQPGDYARLFINDSIGIIKTYVLSEDTLQVFELQRYNIVK